jgi:hypothetical protein
MTDVIVVIGAGQIGRQLHTASVQASTSCLPISITATPMRRPGCWLTLALT